MYVPSSESVPMHSKTLQPIRCSCPKQLGSFNWHIHKLQPRFALRECFRLAYLICHILQILKLNDMGKHCKANLLGGIGPTDSQEEEVLMHQHQPNAWPYATS